MAAIHWKASEHTLSEKIPKYVRQLHKGSGPGNGKPNPIHHYRRSLCDSNCNTKITHLIPYKDKCCNIGPNKGIRSGMTNARVLVDANNNKSTLINHKYCNSTSELLRRRCSLYSQHMSGNVITGIDYTAHPSSNPDGSQVRRMTNCNTSCTTIYKPNNKQFGVQGAVDSSSRIHRLRNNTMRRNLNSLSKTYGLNSATMVYGSPSYNIKSKENNLTLGLCRRNGKKLTCT